MSRHRGEPRRRSRRTRAPGGAAPVTLVAATVAATVAVVGVVVIAAAGGGTAAVLAPAPATADARAATPGPSPGLSPGLSPETAARAAASEAWVHEALPEPSATAPAVGLPADRLFVPSLRIYAPVDTAHAAAGELVLPADASHVARYDASPSLAAEAGTTILAGHVTNSPQVGALFPLAAVARGAMVYTTDAGDRMRAWRVVSVSAPLKAELPHSLFTSSGPRRLAIITCGGSPTAGPDGTLHYPRNVVVIATPVAAW